jgi:hypothetical protein
MNCSERSIVLLTSLRLEEERTYGKRREERRGERREERMWRGWELIQPGLLNR